MKLIFSSLLLIVFINGKAQDGALDFSFGTNGRVFHSVGGDVSPDLQKIIVLSPGNKILHCFTVLNGMAGNDFGLARYNSDGTLDGTFGTGGIVKTDFGGEDFATSLIVQTDGKIVVGGYSISGGISVFAIARYSSSGVLDASFDTDGKRTTTVGTDDFAYSVSVQPDGKILHAGYSLTSPGNFDFSIVRYNTNGSLDSGFDTDGKVTTDINSTREDAAYAIALQVDGKIVLGGYHFDGVKKVFALVRYTPAGALDASFGGGKITTSFGTEDAVLYAMNVQNNGVITTAGYHYNGTNNDIALARYNSNGSLDGAFDLDGKVTTPIGSADDKAHSVSIQLNGKIVVAGVAYDASPDAGNTDNDFVVVRYNTNGSVDGTFGGGMGYSAIDFTSSDDIGYSLASQGNNLIVAGTVGVSLGLARLINSSPILPLSFTSFTASKQTNSVLLNWQTAYEQNIASYELERSDNGNNYQALGNLPANGNANSAISSYSFTDHQPLQIVNFYRLKILHTDGRIVYSKVIAIRFDKSAVALQAFPNPVRNTLNLQFTLPKGDVKINMYDASGRAVKMLQLQSNGDALSVPIDMSNLQKGIYIIRVNNDAIKVIKE